MLQSPSLSRRMKQLKRSWAFADLCKSFPLIDGIKINPERWRWFLSHPPEILDSFPWGRPRGCAGRAGLSCRGCRIWGFFYSQTADLSSFSRLTAARLHFLLESGVYGQQLLPRGEIKGIFTPSQRNALHLCVIHSLHVNTPRGFYCCLCSEGGKKYPKDWNNWIVGKEFLSCSSPSCDQRNSLLQLPADKTITLKSLLFNCPCSPQINALLDPGFIFIFIHAG